MIFPWPAPHPPLPSFGPAPPCPRLVLPPPALAWTCPPMPSLVPPPHPHLHMPPPPQMDVEGYEPVVWSGCKKLFTKYKVDNFIMEYSPGEGGRGGDFSMEPSPGEGERGKGRGGDFSMEPSPGEGGGGFKPACVPGCGGGGLLHWATGRSPPPLPPRVCEVP